MIPDIPPELLLRAGLGAIVLPDVPPELLLRGGLGAIVLAVVYMVLRGQLVPRRILEDVQRERDEWRSTAVDALKQNGQLLAGARVVNDVLQALPHTKREPGQDKFEHDVDRALGGDR